MQMCLGQDHTFRNYVFSFSSEQSIWKYLHTRNEADNRTLWLQFTLEQTFRIHHIQGIRIRKAFTLQGNSDSICLHCNDESGDRCVHGYQAICYRPKRGGKRAPPNKAKTDSNSTERRGGATSTSSSLISYSSQKTTKVWNGRVWRVNTGLSGVILWTDIRKKKERKKNSFHTTPNFLSEKELRVATRRATRRWYLQNVDSGFESFWIHDETGKFWFRNRYESGNICSSLTVVLSSLKVHISP